VRYLEFGDDQVAKVDIIFFGGQRTGEIVGPCEDLVAEKAHFGSSRIRRWFGREWTATDAGAASPSGPLAVDWPVERPHARQLADLIGVELPARAGAS
jgi:hypothetical protein